MKLFSILGVFLITAVTVLGGFRVPSSVFTVDEMAEATAKAKEGGRALAFVLSDAGTT